MRIEPLKLMPVGSRIAADTVAPVTEEGKSFSSILKDAIGEVNTLQQQSAAASMNLATGKLEDISQVTIAAEKASIALQLTMQVRNKVVDAYQEVMRMSV